MFTRIQTYLRSLFSPPPGSPRWMIVLPFAVLGVLILAIFAGTAYGWEYTNSPAFCESTGHTMPPQDAT